MSGFREAALKEMGLAPLWVRRAATAEPDDVQVLPQISEAVSIDGSLHVKTMDWPTLQSVVRDCTACSLCQTRKQTVFGVGRPDAKWMLIGEAPGAEEDAKGEPFVGQAGRLLDNMLASIRLTREQDVFIANVLKCRPPGNRNPAPEEVRQCEPYLLRQIALIQPRMIVVLGRFAAQSLLNTDASIASLRGKVHKVKFGETVIPVVVTYHPAYLLRNLPDKAKAWADLCLARSLIDQLN